MTERLGSKLSDSVGKPLSGGQRSYFVEVLGTASAKALSVVSFKAIERMGEPYRITIELTHPEALDRSDYLGRDATFTIAPPTDDPLDGVSDAPARTFSGCITAFSHTQTTADFRSYRVVIEAHIARLKLTRTSRIYQQQSAPQIIEAILRRHGFEGHRFAFKLRRTYPVHAFRFQYQLADWPYIHVLTEQEGIYSYIVPGKHGDVVVFADDIDHYLYQPELRVPYRETAGLEAAGTEAVPALQTHAQTVPQSLRVADGAQVMQGVTDASGQIPIDHRTPTKQYTLKLANGVTHTLPVAESYRGDTAKGELANQGFQYHEGMPGTDAAAPDRAVHRQGYHDLLHPDSET